MNVALQASGTTYDIANMKVLLLQEDIYATVVEFQNKHLLCVAVFFL